MYDHDVARRAVYGAMRVMHWPDTLPQDWEDMRQEAALAVWRTQERGAGYAYKSAVNAVLAWRMRFVGGWARHDRPPQKTPQSGAVQFEDWMAVPENDTELAGLPDEIIEQLIDMFYAARIKRGERGSLAAVRDTLIVMLICRGYNNAGIATELEMPEGTVKKYRHAIRYRLRRIMEKKWNYQKS